MANGPGTLSHCKSITSIVDNFANEISYHRCQSTEFWDSVKPSRLANKPSWMTFDDNWVEEVRRAVKACAVFAWYPLYC